LGISATKAVPPPLFYNSNMLKLLNTGKQKLWSYPSRNAGKSTSKPCNRLTPLPPLHTGGVLLIVVCNKPLTIFLSKRAQKEYKKTAAKNKETKIMENHILALIRNAIPYCKDLRAITGSVTAAILLQRLDYWFSEFPDGFYKFLEPCNHELYREGDSWTEELGFSQEEFTTAWKKIGHSYKSVKEYKMAQGDKFQGKFYIAVYDRMTHKTTYYRNHKLLDQALETLVNR